MGDTLYNSSLSRRDPYWRNMPPRVPRHVMPEDLLSPFKPVRFNYPSARHAYHIRLDKWNNLKENYHKMREPGDPSAKMGPGWIPRQYTRGSSPENKWTPEGKDWPTSKRFLEEGRPDTETLRAMALYRVRRPPEDLYAHTSVMTTSYRLPLLSVGGALQKYEPYGLTHRHRQHGLMTFEDFY